MICYVITDTEDDQLMNVQKHPRRRRSRRRRHHNHHHHVLCLTISPQPFPKRILHRVRFSASPFKFQYLLVSRRHPAAPYALIIFSSFLSFLQRRILEGSSYIRRSQITQPSKVLLYAGCSFPLDSKQDFFIVHQTGPIDLLHPSPAPHFKTMKVFLVYLPKCPNFSTVQRHVPNVVYHYFLPHIYVQLLVKTFLLNVVFTMAILDLNLRVHHLASFVIRVPKELIYSTFSSGF